MADISTELQAIMDAVYGEEVRGSIHDAIEKINEVSEDSSEEASNALETANQASTTANNAQSTADAALNRSAGAIEMARDRIPYPLTQSGHRQVGYEGWILTGTGTPYPEWTEPDAIRGTPWPEGLDPVSGKTIPDYGRPGNVLVSTGGSGLAWADGVDPEAIEDAVDTYLDEHGVETTFDIEDDNQGNVEFVGSNTEIGQLKDNVQRLVSDVPVAGKEGNVLTWHALGNSFDAQHINAKVSNDGAGNVTIDGELGELIADVVSDGEGRVELVTQESETSITEAVDEWLTEHPEATTTVEDGAVTEEKLSSELKKKIVEGQSSIDILRTGRIIDRFGYTEESNVLRNQSCTYYDNKYYVGGNYSGNTTQSICVYNNNGELIKSKTDYTQLGHLNSITATGEYLVTANANSSAEFSVIDINTLEYLVTYSINDMGYSLGTATYDNDVYLFGLSTETECVILKLTDVLNGSYDIVCRFPHPDNTVLQSFTVYSKYAYTVSNKSNMIHKIDLQTGNIVYKYSIPDGDGWFPVGEPEDLFFMDGDIYLWSAVYYNTSQAMARAVSICGQIFKTNLLRSIDKTIDDSYMHNLTPVRLTVDGNSSYNFNPSTTFQTVEEACYVLNYHKHGDITVSNISHGIVSLIDGTYSIVGLTGSRTVDYVEMLSSNVIDSQLSSKRFYIYRSTCRLKSISANEMSVWWSDLSINYVNLSQLTEFEFIRSVLNVNTLAGYNSSATITATESQSNEIRISSQYVSAMGLLAAMAYNLVTLTIWNVNAPIFGVFHKSEVTGATKTERTIYNHPSYDKLSVQSGKIFLRNKDNQTESEVTTATVVTIATV